MSRKQWIDAKQKIAEESFDHVLRVVTLEVGNKLWRPIRNNVSVSIGRQAMRQIQEKWWEKR